MPTKDPLTQVHETLWEMLEASTDFCALVSEQNRIKYLDPVSGTTRYPEKESRLPPERAQVLIHHVGLPVAMRCSSDGTMLNERFQIWIYTSDRRLNYLKDGIYQGLFPLQWAILRAMMPWETYLKPLAWGGFNYVHDCSVPAGQQQLESPRAEEQLAPVKSNGWFLAWQGDVEMWFPSTSLSL